MTSNESSSREELRQRVDRLTQVLSDLQEELSHAEEELESVREDLGEAASFPEEPAEPVPEAGTPELVPEEVESAPIADLAEEGPDPGLDSFGETPVESAALEARDVQPSDDDDSEEEASEIGDVETPVAPVPETVPVKGFADSERAIDLETKIGAYWFNRIGLVALVIGFSLFARYVHPFLEPWHKVASGYLASFVLYVLGWYYRDRLKQFSRPVMAGGMSVAFFTSYAGHFVGPMACLPLPASLALMSASVGWVLWVADLWKSEPTAGLAVFLGHVAAYTSASDADGFSLAAILFLSLTTFVLFLRHDWLPLGLFAVLAAFLSHLLWAVQDHPPSTPKVQFWTNFLFLTSYYTIFLFADLVYRHRIWKRGPSAYSLRQKSAGRAVGPAALILYVTLASAFFWVTRVYWGNIHLYLFPLGILQAGLVRYHRRRGNADYPFYAAAAATFLTLGFFSWLDALALNLALAAEALMLLVLARRVGLWSLNPLAQVVLVVNFLHFWNSDARHLLTWPQFFGSVATAFVYFVKSRLEETWRRGQPDEEIAEPAWAARIREELDEWMRPLAYLHAISGAVLVAFQCHAFFRVPFSALFLAFFALAGVFFSLWCRSGPPVVATLLGFASCVVFFFQHWLIDAGLSVEEVVVSGRSFWFFDHIIVVLMVTGAWIAMGASRWLWSGVYYVLGLATLALAALALLLVSHIGESIVWLVPVWAFAPLVFWLEVDLSRRDYGRWERISGSTPEGRSAALANYRAARSFLAVAAAISTHLAVGSVLTSHSAELLLMSFVTLAVLWAAVKRNNPYFAFGLIFHVFLTLLRLNLVIGSVGAEYRGLLMWWVIATAIGAACVLSVSAPIAKRGTFAWAGIAILLVSMWSILLPIARALDFSPFGLWILSVFAFWIPIEVLRVNFAERKKNHYKDWTDRYGVKSLRKNSIVQASILSVFAAVLLFFMTSVHLESWPKTLWATGFYYVIFLSLLAALLRSPSLAAACFVVLTLAHFSLHETCGSDLVSNGYPVLTLALISVALCFVGCIEGFCRDLLADKRQAVRNSVSVGVCYSHLLGLVLGWCFCHAWAQNFFSRLSATYPATVFFVLAVVATGAWFRLAWMQVVALSFTALVVLHLLAASLEEPALQAGLVLAGVLVSTALLLMERIVSRQDEKVLESISGKLRTISRTTLVIVAAGVMVFLIRTSEEMRESWMTFGWSLVAVTLMGLGFLLKESVYRRVALVIFLMSIARAACIDIMRLEIFYRMLAFTCLGVCLLVVSHLYDRYRDELKRWL